MPNSTIYLKKDCYRVILLLGNQSQIDNWLHEAIAIAQAGDYVTARSMLLDIVDHDPYHETAWYLLYQISNRHDDRRVCLENMVIINPSNEWAKHELARYLVPHPTLPALPPPPQKPVASPPPLKKESPPSPPSEKTASSSSATDYVTVTALRVVMAFWVGMAVVFLMGGIITTSEWLINGLRSRTLPYTITLAQFVELMIALMFLAMGVMSVIISLGLYVRSTIGVYGSLFVALLLLTLGPLLSLIPTYPNYLIAICTGGVSGVIVLLTLASLSETNTD